MKVEEIRKVLDDEFTVVVNELFHVAGELGFDLENSESDVDRLNLITDGGRIRYANPNDDEGELQACKAIPEYAAATLTERMLGQAFHFLYLSEKARECPTFGDAGCHDESHLIKYIATLNRLVGFLQVNFDDVDINDATVREYLSENGRIGAEKRHGPMTELRLWTLAEYKKGKWLSANKAAHALKDQVMRHGRTIGAVLTEENGQRTIAEWIRKSV